MYVCVCGGGVLEERAIRWQGTGLRPADPPPTASSAEVQGKNTSQALHRLTRYCGGAPGQDPLTLNERMKP